jgi:protein ImuB
MHRAGEPWLLAGVTRGAVDEIVGPYKLSGGWWSREIQRDYYFAKLASGPWLWVYWDGARRRWFWQGVVS